jgi:hypothetical protein
MSSTCQLFILLADDPATQQWTLRETRNTHSILFGEHQKMERPLEVSKEIFHTFSRQAHQYLYCRFKKCYMFRPCLRPPSGNTTVQTRPKHFLTYNKDIFTLDGRKYEASREMRQHNGMSFTKTVP